MHWEFTLRTGRHQAADAGRPWRPTQRRVAFASALALAGCVGSVGDGAVPGGTSGTGAPPVTNPNDPSTPPGTDPPIVKGPAPVATSCKADQIGISPLRRLTKLEYDNSIKELLGTDLKLSEKFSEDELAGPFPGNYFTPISESQYAQYERAAATAADKAMTQLGQLVPCAANVKASDEAACATQFIKQFGRRAYRRPLDAAEVGRYEALFKDGRSSGPDFASGINLVIEGMLESPHFVYLVEGPGPLTQHQLAARLSYFLWNAPPDDKLSSLADSGGLSTPQSLRDEAKRMLADPRAKGMLDDFYMHWLGLDDLDTLVKDPMKFPDFEAVHPSMREEVSRFASYVMNEGDGKLTTLMTAPFTVANPALAKLYGAKTTSTDWAKVDLDPTQRAGILTQSAYLATNGHEGSAPIFRGIAIREQLLCVDLPPPPPGVDAKFPPPSATKTTRERLTQHRLNPECASCHSLMDVLGYGFESFDDMGKYRTTENNVKIDDSGELIGTDVDGTFKGPIELAQKLSRSTDLQKCVAKQWFRYALGRIETQLDKCTLDTVFDRFQKSELRLPELLLALVESDGFRIRVGEESK
jgi:hypothetical protein